MTMSDETLRQLIAYHAEQCGILAATLGIRDSLEIEGLASDIIHILAQQRVAQETPATLPLDTPQHHEATKAAGG